MRCSLRLELGFGTRSTRNSARNKLVLFFSAEDTLKRNTLEVTPFGQMPNSSRRNMERLRTTGQKARISNKYCLRKRFPAYHSNILPAVNGYLANDDTGWIHSNLVYIAAFCKIFLLLPPLLLQARDSVDINHSIFSIMSSNCSLNVANAKFAASKMMSLAKAMGQSHLQLLGPIPNSYDGVTLLMLEARSHIGGDSIAVES